MATGRGADPGLFFGRGHAAFRVHPGDGGAEILTPAAPRRGVRAAAIGLMLALLWLLAEAALHVLPSLAPGGQLLGLLYFPQDISVEEYDRYLAVRDPLLGWPPPGQRGTGETDAAGARLSPAFPVPGGECVTAYGDSFTYGAEVGPEEAWANQLARLLGCRVGNFGGNGHGTDQALLRFQHNPDDPSGAVLLGIHADNLLRNLNQNRGYLTGASLLGMKPRFILRDGALELVPLPRFTYQEFQDALANPARAWPHEAFLPGTAAGPTVWAFPYSAALLHLLRSRHVRNYVQGLPSWIDYYDPAHDSGAIPLAVAIAGEFRRLAQARGKRLTIMMFPSGTGHDIYLRRGTSSFDPLNAALRAEGQEVVDLTEAFARVLGTERLCALLTQQAACVGHLNARGNAIVAATMAGHISRAR